MVHPKRRLACRFLAAAFPAAALLAAACLPSTPARAAEASVRVGVLKFGTVNWELDTMRAHGLDRAAGATVAVTALGSGNATAVALQAGTVDVIVSDWLWVSRQRDSGRDYTFVPHSLAVGGLMVRPDSGIGSVADLAGRKLGIAGGPVDKSWLVLRTYARRRLGWDPADRVEAVFGAPPLLNALMLRNEVPAVLNFWHYNARLSAAGMVEVLPVDGMLRELGVETRPPLLGWVFSEAWADAHGKAIAGFLDASRAAKRMLAESDAEWDRLRPLTKSEDDAVFQALRRAYRHGIPERFGAPEIAAAEAMYAIMAAVGGDEVTGGAGSLAAGTFWNGYRF